MRRFELLYETTQQVLGQGSFGQVFLAKKRSNGELVAVKTIQKNSSLAISEIDLLSKLSKQSHPNIMKVHDIFDQGGFYYIVQEYCNGGTLLDHLTKQRVLSEEQSIEILDQVANGLEYLHAINIVHRDIKPENVLRHVVNGQSFYKITDFGLSCMADGIMTSKFGTAYYVAPEIIDGRGEGYDKTVDIWALGIMFDELLHGSPFYDGKVEDDVYMKIRNEPYYVRKQEYSLPRLTQKKQIVASVLNGMIQRDPASRRSLSWVVEQAKQYKQLNQQAIASMFELEPLERKSSNPTKLCQVHNLIANFRIPYKTNDKDGKMIQACIRCLKQYGIYDMETMQKKIEEALRMLTFDNFDSHYNSEGIKEEVHQTRIQLLNGFAYFTIRDEHLSIQYDQILNDTMRQARVQYNNRIKQLGSFRDKNYTTSSKEELWLVYVAEKISDDVENEFILYITDELEQASEHAIEECRMLMLELLHQAIQQLDSLQ